jgi:hypothetical protein
VGQSSTGRTGDLNPVGGGAKLATDLLRQPGGVIVDEEQLGPVVTPGFIALDLDNPQFRGPVCFLRQGRPGIGSQFQLTYAPIGQFRSNSIG